MTINDGDFVVFSVCKIGGLMISMPVNVEMSNKADQQNRPAVSGPVFFTRSKMKKLSVQSLLVYNNQSSQMLNSGQNVQVCDATKLIVVIQSGQ